MSTCRHQKDAATERRRLFPTLRCRRRRRTPAPTIDRQAALFLRPQEATGGSASGRIPQPSARRRPTSASIFRASGAAGQRGTCRTSPASRPRAAPEASHRARVLRPGSESALYLYRPTRPRSQPSPAHSLLHLVSSRAVRTFSNWAGSAAML